MPTSLAPDGSSVCGMSSFLRRGGLIGPLWVELRPLVAAQPAPILGPVVGGLLMGSYSPSTELILGH